MSESLPQSNCLELAVVGGGISGLTAAYRLSKLLPEAKIELFEAGDRIGGVICTRHTDELLVELGADSFIDKTPAAVDLCRELGLEDQIVHTNATPRRALVYHKGKLHPVPEGFVQMRPARLGPMLRSPLLSWRGKLRLLAERWMPTSANLADKNFDESVASFATRRLGRETFERLVQPLLAGIYTADPYQLSVAATIPGVLEAERRHGSLRRAALVSPEHTLASGARYASFVTLRDGLACLVDALRGQLDQSHLHLQTPVSEVTPTDDRRWQVKRADGVQSSVFHGVIVALPAPAASRLLSSASHELSEELRSIPYASSAVAALAYRRDLVKDPLDGFGLVVPTIESSKIVAASFSSVKFPGRAPQESVLIRVFLGGALQPELLEKSDEELLSLAHAEISDILRIQGAPSWSELMRWTEKMPQYHVGHVQRVDRIENLANQQHGLELAGNAYRGVGIPQCVQSGDAAARRIVESLSRC